MNPIWPKKEKNEMTLKQWAANEAGNVESWGGKREGAGRPPAKPKDRKVKIWFSVKASKEKQARKLIEPIIESLNK